MTVYGTRPDNSGEFRDLFSSVLERFPQTDRVHVAFPKEVVSFFTEMKEKV